MAINWKQVEEGLSPIKNYEELCRRLKGSFSYPFIQDTYDFSTQELIVYTQRLLGGDSRGRYKEYETNLTHTMKRLDKAGCESVYKLISQTDSKEQLERFVDQIEIPAVEITRLLKYLIYWFIPSEKYLSGLVRPGSNMRETIQVLAEHGIRTNLQLLQQGITQEGRTSLAELTGLPLEVIMQAVNRADFSRMPWASKATISNIIEAGYPSIASLAGADPEQLYADFFRYGKSIGKNLKLGNEIENSYRIAKIIPILVKKSS